MPTTKPTCCVHPKTKELVSCNLPGSLPLGLALLAVVVLRRKS